MADHITILAGHPYFELERPAVWQTPWDKRWTVRWRDFHTMKHDADFDTQQQAEAFASTLCRPPLTVYDNGWDIGDSDRYWRDRAAKELS